MTSDADRELPSAAAPSIEGEPGVAQVPTLIEPDGSQTRITELASSYFLSGAKVISIAAISAMLWRETSNSAIASFVIVRSLLNLIVYVFAGASATMVRRVEEARRKGVAVESFADQLPSKPSGVLAYASRSTNADWPEFIAYAQLRNGFLLVALLIFVGTAFAMPLLAHAPIEINRAHLDFACYMILGQLIRGLSEVWSGRLIARGLLARDNVLGAIADLAWAFPLSFAQASWRWSSGQLLEQVGWMYFASAVLLASVRGIWVSTFLRSKTFGLQVNPFPGLKPAFAISAAMLADFLYAPATYFIVRHFLRSQALVDYAPAVQIDTALVLLVSGLASLALPKSALAAGARDRHALERLFVRGTLTSLTMLVAAACVVIVFRRPLLDAWLGGGVEGTIAILPLVLIHTVLGGASGVMRSILLGIGEAKAYTLAALAGGVLNITLGYTLAVPLGLGLKGIVLGTIIAVGLRCAIWMPWYTHRAIQRV